MKVLIAGAGDVGTRLGLLLAEDGHEVWALRRSASKVREPLRAFGADLTDPESLAPLPGDFHQVFYTAAADESSDEAYRRAYVEGLANVIEAVGDAPRRIVFVSSTSVYGQDGGAWVDETSPTEPGSFRGRRLLEAEAVLRAAGEAASSRSTVAVRFAGIYGPGRRRLVDSVRRGEAVIWDDPPRWTNRIHVDDCARVLRHVATLDDPAGIYVGVDAAPTLDAEVKTWLARRLGVPIPPSASETDRERRRGGNKRCANRRLAESGYRFVHPDYRSGYGAMLGEETPGEAGDED